MSSVSLILKDTHHCPRQEKLEVKSCGCVGCREKEQTSDRERSTHGVISLFKHNRKNDNSGKGKGKSKDLL